METNKNSAPAGVLTDERIDQLWSETLTASPLPQPAYMHLAKLVESEVLATRASVDLSGLTRYVPVTDRSLAVPVASVRQHADGDFVRLSDVRALLATSAAEGSEQTSVPSVGSIDTPELQNLANTWAGKLHSFYRSERDSAAQAWKALITHIDAHLARQSQAVALLRDAIQKELNPAWECNSYHPAIHAAMSATENLVAPAAQMGSAQATPFSAEAKASWRIQDPPAVVDQLCKATQRLLDAACNHISSTDDSELAKAAEEADRALADCVGDWPAAQADVRDAALEEAAKVCDALESDMFDQYKGRGTHAPNNPYRADPYMNGQSDGAGQCANAIRAMRTSTTAGEGGA